MMTRRSRMWLGALLACIAGSIAVPIAATGAPAAASASGSQLHVLQVDTSRFPDVRIAFTNDDSSEQLPALTITENGDAVSNVSAYAGKIGHFDSNPRTAIVLAIDASDSMKGRKFTNALAAAESLINQAHRSDRIGIVSFGSSARVVVPPTEDHASLTAALHDISLSHGTALFDGIVDAAAVLPQDATRRVIVVLSDGADKGSSHSLSDAQDRVNQADTEVYSVGLTGGESDPATLKALANASGGSFVDVSDAASLSSVYAELGKQLLRGYWLEYHSGVAPGQPVTIGITADGQAPVTRTYAAPTVAGAGGAIDISTPHAASAPRPTLTLPHGGLGVLIAAAPFALLIAFAGYRYVAGRGQTPLQARIEPYVRSRSSESAPDQQRRGRGIKQSLAPLFAATESILTGSRLFNRMGFLLEQANLPLRQVELLYLMIGTGTGGGFAIGTLSGSLFIGMGGLLIGTCIPYVWVAYRARKRKRQFEGQLADVLNTIAASLRAGHSFNQSITAVIKETPDPTAHELSRVMTEARLGLPLEEALDAMARRMGSADFDFAVTTVNIQRTVGGSLSEILEMVGDTVRGRQQFRKKVKALTSMGSMSAYVLMGMPFFMGGMLSLLSPNYMAPLWHTTPGHFMLAACAVFMFIGWAACTKIVSIKT